MKLQPVVKQFEPEQGVVEQKLQPVVKQTEPAHEVEAVEQKYQTRQYEAIDRTSFNKSSSGNEREGGFFWQLFMQIFNEHSEKLLGFLMLSAMYVGYIHI